jgi:hypothetical protein
MKLGESSMEMPEMLQEVCGPEVMSRPQQCSDGGSVLKEERERCLTTPEARDQRYPHRWQYRENELLLKDRISMLWELSAKLNV